MNADRVIITVAFAAENSAGDTDRSVTPSESARQASGEVEIALEGIPINAIKDIRLVYIGTISPVMSRTKSNVMKSHYNYWGAGQEDWYAPRSTFIESKVKPKSGTVKLPFDRPLVKGDNHFYISLNIASKKVDLTSVFSCGVKSISLDGEKASFLELGPAGGRRYGIALRNHGDDGVDTYRIPGLATTKKGDLFAVYDIRWNTYYDLQADIDIELAKEKSKEQIRDEIVSVAILASSQLLGREVLRGKDDLFGTGKITAQDFHGLVTSSGALR